MNDSKRERGRSSSTKLKTRSKVKKLGDYQLGELIGKGASSQVFKAVHVGTGHFVAIKEINLKIKKQQQRKLMAEVNMLKKFDHPNIVHYLGLLKNDTHMCFILEYVEGGSLLSLLSDFGVFPESLCVRYIHQVLMGLDYLHSQKVIHRDVKAANILITKKGKVKLSDFGISHTIDESSENGDMYEIKHARESQTSFGSPFWMAPEVIEMSSATTASDLWSVACTIIELLDGEPPYYEMGNIQAMFKIVNEPIPPIPPYVSTELEDFLKKCFSRDPALRPTAQELFSHPWLATQDSSPEPKVVEETDEGPVMDTEEKSDGSEVMSFRKLSMSLLDFNKANASQRGTLRRNSRSAATIDFSQTEAIAQEAGTPTQQTDPPPSEPTAKPTSKSERLASSTHERPAERTDPPPTSASDPVLQLPKLPTGKQSTPSQKSPKRRGSKRSSSSKAKKRLSREIQSTMSATQARLNKEKITSIQAQFGSTLKFDLAYDTLDTIDSKFNSDGYASLAEDKKGMRDSDPMSPRKALESSNKPIVRWYVRDGALTKICRAGTQVRWFFLFDDLLIYAASKSNRYVFHRLIKLRDLEVQELPRAESSLLKNAFNILSTDKSFTVIAENEEDKSGWIGDLLNLTAGKTARGESKPRFFAPVWVPDSQVKACSICETNFTPFRRRHHCRVCGLIICSHCAPGRAVLATNKEQDGKKKDSKLRVCAQCFNHPSEAVADIFVFDKYSTLTKNSSKSHRESRRKALHQALQSPSSADKDREGKRKVPLPPSAEYKGEEKDKDKPPKNDDS